MISISFNHNKYVEEAPNKGKYGGVTYCSIAIRNHRVDYLLYYTTHTQTHTPSNY